MNQGEAMKFSARVETAGDKLRTESVGEYSIPDYQPQIRRILRVHTRVLPSGRYARGGRIESAGLCVHTVLYSTDHGRLATIDVTSEYSFSFAADEEAIVFLLPPQVEGVSCRLSGPRRITLRATLLLVPHVYASLDAEDKSSAELLSDADTVRLCHPLIANTYAQKTVSELAFSDTRAIEAGTELLVADAVAEVLEVKASDRGATVKGEILCRALLSREGVDAYFLHHRIPFENEVECEAEEGSRIFAYPSVVSFEAKALSGDGAGSRLAFDVGLEIELEILTPGMQKVVVDAFSLKSPLVARKQRLPMTEMLGAVFHKHDIECRISRSESDSEAASAVLDLGISLHLRSQSREEGELRVQGEARVDAALVLGSEDAEGTPDYMACVFSSPFALSIPLPSDLADDADLELLYSVRDVKGRLEAASLVAVGEILFTLRMSRRRMLTLAVGMQECDGACEGDFVQGEIICVYPSAGDSLFSLAQKYRLRPEAIAEANRLAPEALESADLPSSIDGCVRLLIEK